MNANKNPLAKVGRRLRQVSGLQMVFTGVLIIVGVLVIALIWRSLSSSYSDKNPMLVEGPVSAFSTRGLKTNGYAVPAPQDGLGFSYSSWVYVQSSAFRRDPGKDKIILMKGSKGSPSNSQFMITIDADTNNLKTVVKDINGQHSSHCVVTNFPLQKWVHVCVIVNNRTVDVYIDGKLERSCVMGNIPASQSSGNSRVYIGKSALETPKGKYVGGFFGQISRVQYYSTALDPAQVMDIYADGPSTETSPLLRGVSDRLSGMYKGLKGDLRCASDDVHHEMSKF